MAVDLTVEALRAAIRLGNTTEETAEATRLLAYATEAVEQHAVTAPTVIQNEAVIRLSAYLFDQPHAGRGDSHANALRGSGAARILAPYVVHSAALDIGTDGTPGPTPDPTPGGTVDPFARAQAQQALTLAGDAQRTATTNSGFLSTFMARVRAIVEAIVPAWARAANPPQTGKGVLRGVVDVAGQTDIPTYLATQISTPADGEVVAAYTTATAYLFRYSSSAWSEVVSWPRVQGTGGGGLSKAEVEALIAADVPRWARVPDPSAGTDDHVLSIRDADNRVVVWRRTREIPEGGSFGQVLVRPETTAGDRNFAWGDGPRLADSGGLAYGASGLHTVPSLVSVGKEADANKLSIASLTTRFDQLSAPGREFITVEPGFLALSAEGLQVPLTVILHGFTSASRPMATKVRISLRGVVLATVAWSAATVSDRVLMATATEVNATTIFDAATANSDDHLVVEAVFFDASDQPIGQDLTYSLPLGTDAVAALAARVAALEAGSGVQRFIGQFHPGLGSTSKIMTHRLFMAEGASGYDEVRADFFSQGQSEYQLIFNYSDAVGRFGSSAASFRPRSFYSTGFSMPGPYGPSGPVCTIELLVGTFPDHHSLVTRDDEDFRNKGYFEIRFRLNSPTNNKMSELVALPSTLTSVTIAKVGSDLRS